MDLIDHCFQRHGKREPVNRRREHDRIGLFQLRREFIEIVVEHARFSFAETQFAGGTTLDGFTSRVDTLDDMGHRFCSLGESVGQKIAVAAPSWTAGEKENVLDHR